MPEPNDDQAAREARARKLREKVDQIVRGEPESEPEGEDESARDFVHRRMMEEREADEAADEEDPPDGT